jgi:hypothetical protein
MPPPDQTPDPTAAERHRERRGRNQQAIQPQTCRRYRFGLLAAHSRAAVLHRQAKQVTPGWGTAPLVLRRPRAAVDDMIAHGLPGGRVTPATPRRRRSRSSTVLAFSPARPRCPRPPTPAPVHHQRRHLLLGELAKHVAGIAAADGQHHSAAVTLRVASPAAHLQ